MKKWEYFTKEELESFVKESTSLHQVAVKCGYSEQSGSGNNAIKEMIDLYGFDTSHFFELNGVSHNKGQYDYDRFQKGRYIKNGNSTDALIALRGHQCENCHNSEWIGQKIPLEVHHIDGDRMNNELTNLQLLCPNCHALTENYRGKNIVIQQKDPVSEEDFKKALEESPNIRQALLKLKLAPKGGNYTRANEIIAKYGISFKK
jgi:hypothetical protein